MGKATKKQQEFAQQISTTLNIQLPQEPSFENLKIFIADHIDQYMKLRYTMLGERIKKEVSILDYVRQAGFTLKRVGNQGLYTTMEHDSLIIDPHRNCYWFNSVGDADSVIGFVAKYIFDGDVKAAIDELASRLNDSDYQPTVRAKPGNTMEKERKELVLPKKNHDMRRVFAYLTKTRLIDPDIVQEFVIRDMLYQDIRGNCVFVAAGRDGNPVFVSLRGTNTHKRFIGDAEGSDYQQGFFIDNKSDSLIVTESVIDSMSIMAILKHKKIDYHKYNYLPLSGVDKFLALYYQLDYRNIRKVLLAFDNDAAGHKMARVIAAKLEDRPDLQVSIHIPEAKDWNQEIIDSFKAARPLSDINFFRKRQSDVPHHGSRDKKIER